MIRLRSLQQHPCAKSQFRGGEAGAGPTWPCWEPCGAKNEALGCSQAPVRRLWGRAQPWGVRRTRFLVAPGLRSPFPEVSGHQWEVPLSFRDQALGARATGQDHWAVPSISVQLTSGLTSTRNVSPQRNLIHSLSRSLKKTECRGRGDLWKFSYRKLHNGLSSYKAEGHD